MVASIVIGIIIFIIAVVIYLEYRNEKRYKEEQRRKEEKKERKLTPKVTKRPAGTTTVDKEESSDTKSNRPKPAHLQQEGTPQRRAGDKPSEKKTVPKRETETVASPKQESPVSRQEKTATPAETKKIEPVKEKTKEQKPEKTATTKPAAPKTATKAPTKEVSEKETSTELPKGEYPDFNYERLIEMGLSEEEAMEFIQELIPQIGEQIPLIDEAMKIPDFHKMERLTHSIKGSSTTIGTGGVSDLLVEYNTYLKTGEELPVAKAYQKHLKRYFEKLKKQFPPKN